MVICDGFLHRLSQLVKIFIELFDINLEKRFFHGDKRVSALDDVAGIVHDIA